MGGHDPYSSSKGCAELVTAAYRASFFKVEGRGGVGSPPGVATVRAGNVIGGGDWADDRIIPDCVRALSAGDPVVVRNPAALRPWQHVLEPLSGYLWLAASMVCEPGTYAGPWNFGPADSDGARDVRWVVQHFLDEWGSGEWTTPQTNQSAPTEAHLLSLDSAKARQGLGWRPVWDTSQAVRHTAAWYREYLKVAGVGPLSGSSIEGMRALTSSQLAEYEAAASTGGLPWANPARPAQGD
jgi:CDP-glucose 4,6-dehydratase